MISESLKILMSFLHFLRESYIYLTIMLLYFVRQLKNKKNKNTSKFQGFPLVFSWVTVLSLKF